MSAGVRRCWTERRPLPHAPNIAASQRLAARVAASSSRHHPAGLPCSSASIANRTSGSVGVAGSDRGPMKSFTSSAFEYLLFGAVIFVCAAEDAVSAAVTISAESSFAYR